MTIARTSGKLSVFALAMIASPAVMAIDYDYSLPMFYLGGNVGLSKSHFDEGGMTRAVAPGFNVTGISEDDDGVGYKLYGGVPLTRNFAIEGGWFDLGKFGYTATGNYPTRLGVPAGTLNAEIKVPKGVNLDLVGIMPVFGDQFSIFGRVGVTRVQTRTNFSGTGAVFFPGGGTRGQETDWGYKFGVGLEYAITRTFAVRAEAERYRVPDTLGGKANVDLFSLGLVWRFYRPPMPVYQPAAYTPPPQPVAPPPPPPPKPKPEAKPEVIAPPPPPPPPPAVVPEPVQKPAPARRDRG